MKSHKNIESLKAEIRRNEAKIEQLQHQVQRRTNRIQHMESGERRARNHRLITRGAAVESIWPEIKPLPEQDFYKLMEIVLNLPEARAVLRSVHTIPIKAPPDGDT